LPDTFYGLPSPYVRIAISIFGSGQNLSEVLDCGKLMAQGSNSFHYLSPIREAGDLRVSCTEPIREINHLLSMGCKSFKIVQQSKACFHSGRLIADGMVNLDFHLAIGVFAAFLGQKKRTVRRGSLLNICK
jgi:hypothetical protein